MIAAAILAVLAAAAIGAAIWPLHRAARLERELEAHDRNMADLQALADVTREPPPLDDGHADRLLRIVRDREAEL